MEKRQVYLDNAATTKVDKRVVEAMLPEFTENYGNPSSIYSQGQAAADAVGAARHTIAAAIGASDKELFFTSGGSEADNWALKGAAQVLLNKGQRGHIITTAIEHHAVLHTVKALEKEGFTATYLPVDPLGFVDAEDLRCALSSHPDTFIVSVMLANNEVGTIEPIKKLANLTHAHAKVAGTPIIFHTDAVQGFAHMHVDVGDLDCDLMSMSAHKLHGPKGVGALYVRRGTKIENYLDGGAQEFGRRATTENVPGIVGFARAVELMRATEGADIARMTSLRDHAIERMLSEIDYAKLNGAWQPGDAATTRLCNNINVSFEFVEGEGLLLQMSARGVAVSSGSACTSGSLDPSHVLLALGLPHEIAHGSMRMSLDRDTTLEDVDFACDCLVEVVRNLRSMSPLYEDFKNGNYSSIIEGYKKDGMINVN